MAVVILPSYSLCPGGWPSYDRIPLEALQDGFTSQIFTSFQAVQWSHLAPRNHNIFTFCSIVFVEEWTNPMFSFYKAEVQERWRTATCRQSLGGVCSGRRRNMYGSVGPFGSLEWTHLDTGTTKSSRGENYRWAQALDLHELRPCLHRR
jgi:hypothetical protein